MMTEISLNVLDVSENSTRAGASLVTILVTADTSADKLTIVIADNGCGMTPEQAAHVTDPFFTTRTTRKVGLGIPFFKYAAESTGGSFPIESGRRVMDRLSHTIEIESEPGRGTTVTAVFGLSHIDRMPLGNMNATIHNLIVYHPDTDFLYTYTYNDASFTLDTREMREILGGIPLNTPEVSAYIMEYLKENQQETDGGALI